MNRQRLFSFGLMVWQTHGLSHDQLLRIVGAKKRYSPQFRAAALRHLVAAAPVSITGGRPFAERRRRVPLITASSQQYSLTQRGHPVGDAPRITYGIRHV